MNPVHLCALCWLSLSLLCASSNEDVEPPNSSWLGHFTTLIAQERGGLEKTVDPDIGAKLAEQLPREATFRDIVKQLRTLTNPILPT